MDAVAILAAVRSAIPGAKAHLRLSDDGADRLIVGLASQTERRFYDAALDPSDMTREPADIAAEIATMFAQALAASTP